MKLLIIRHGQAMDRAEFQAGRPDATDAERPLTSIGIKRLKKQKLGLKLCLPDVDIFAASPFVRTRETLKILESAFPRAKTDEWSELTPDHTPEIVMRRLMKATTSGIKTIAIVGHEPQLGKLVHWCIAGSAEAHLEIKKGGAILIQWEGNFRKGNGFLQWMLTPSQLRRIARSAQKVGSM